MTVASGRVYDLGYRPYEGVRGGRRSAVVALWLNSLRRALGLRRSWRQKVLPWVLLTVTTVPAAVFVGVAYITRNTPAANIRLITYREYVGISNALLLFVAVTAPDLFCPDRRQRVLPLILSRPLTSLDYVVARAGAVFTIVFAFGLIPQAILFLGQTLVSDGAIRYLLNHAAVLWQAPAAVAVLALYLSVLGSALASLTSRRIVGAASFLGLLLVTSAVSAVLVGGPYESSLAGLIDLARLPLYVRDLVFLGHLEWSSPLGGMDNAELFSLLAYAGVVAVCVAVLVVRYRWTEA